ncbi:NAD-dependent deacetylase sirtuin-2 [Whalleya microplaca]|nr:NAD-dependent deacetylase sirtuin-2 [Whalleya microplaca]
MGQEQSGLVDETTPPQTLSERSLAAVASLIKNGHAKRIVVMTGAGISTAAGIPDFRSPKTGLYHNLARLNLPYPEAVFEIDFFRRNPTPFYFLAKELYPGNFQPTIAHVFVALLAKKGLLHMLFTQNIDCLERAAGVPPDKIVEAHGSFATQRCVDCKTAYPEAAMREHVERGEAPRCARCKGLVKPDIVFFGEQLPEAFYGNMPAVRAADLVLVLGTSLMVQPFASLPRMAADSAPRVLFNLERVGDLGTRADDVLCLGDCDSGIRKLADELGWRDELETKWAKLVGEKEAARQRASGERKEADLEDELERLVGDVEDKLDISAGSRGETGANLAKQEEEEEEEGTDRPQSPEDAPAAKKTGGPDHDGVGGGPAGVVGLEGEGAPPAGKEGAAEEGPEEGGKELEERVASSYTPVQLANEGEEASKKDDVKPTSKGEDKVKPSSKAEDEGGGGKPEPAL